MGLLKGLLFGDDHDSDSDRDQRLDDLEDRYMSNRDDKDSRDEAKDHLVQQYGVDEHEAGDMLDNL